MKTPIKDFIDGYISKNAARMHMPAHKGKIDFGEYDITEISGADSLYEASGIIAESERIASELFGTDTYYSTEGSSLAIRAMLYLAVLNTGKPASAVKVLAGRNAHKVFISAAALIGFDVEWLASSARGYLSCKITPDELDEYIAGMNERPDALYLTSPDYLGNMLDIKGISKVCKKWGVLLLVDNAHGAYLKFLPESLHPSDLGADIVCDSAHKTLPVLTGGAYLHVGSGIKESVKSRVKEALILFGSTSPSYLILRSLDVANELVKTQIIPNMQTYICKIGDLKQKIANLGYEILGDEPMKITIKSKLFGYSGCELAKHLEACGVYPEFADADYLVLMPSQSNEADLDRVYSALASVTRRAEITSAPPHLGLPKRALSPRDALFTDSEELPLEKSLGRVLSSVNIGCPPAVPIVVCGEVIDEGAIEAFTYYGISSVKVIK